jgi:hypothetical protein
MRKRLSSQETAEAVQLIRDGVFYTEIAAKFGITKSGVFRIAKRQGVWNSQQSVKALKVATERLQSDSFRESSRLLKGDPSHSGGKRWKITTPDGTVYQGTNLFSWCQNNAELFAPLSPEEAYRRVMKVGNREGRRWRGWVFEPDDARDDGSESS